MQMQPLTTGGYFNPEAVIDSWQTANKLRALYLTRKKQFVERISRIEGAASIDEFGQITAKAAVQWFLRYGPDHLLDPALAKLLGEPLADLEV